MSIEQSQVLFNLSGLFQDIKQREDPLLVQKAILLIMQMAQQRAKVNLKLLSSCLCFICENPIKKKQFQSQETVKLGCICNIHCHKKCLTDQIMLRKKNLENMDIIVDIMNELYQCFNKCGKQLINQQIILQVLKQKDIAMIEYDYKEAQALMKEELIKQQEEEEKKQVKEFNCAICLDDLDFNVNGYKLQCGCQFCIDCLKGCLIDQVTNNMDIDIEQIICPNGNCKQKLPFEDILAILKDKQEIIEKIEQKNFISMYEKMKRENPDTPESLISCPGKYIREDGSEKIIYIDQDTIDKSRQGKQAIPLLENQKLKDCDFKFIQDRSDKGKVRHKCEKCRYQFCLNNCDALHEGYSCSAYQQWKINQNQDYKKELESQGYRFCPNQNCNVLTFRDSGCNRITCTSCKMSYCFVCYFLAKTSTEVYAHLLKEHGGYY